MTASLARRLEWLRSSGILAEDGGVHAFIDERTGKRAYQYSEITGYFLTLTAKLARVQSAGDWAPWAKRAGHWLLREALQPNGAVLCRKYGNADEGESDPFSFVHGRTCLFDLAVVGRGLLSAGLAYDEPPFVAAAQRIGSFYRGVLETRPEREWPAVVRAADAEPVELGPGWSRRFGAYQLKGVLFLHGIGGASTLVDRLLKYARALPFEHELHPHLYATEGLLALAASRGGAALLDECHHAVTYAFEHLTLQRADVLAQLLRAHGLLRRLAPRMPDRFADRIPELQAALEAWSLPSGGTAYGAEHPEHANAWAHFFAIDELLARQHLHGTPLETV
ncbi:MAG TPA: hypothetical protein VER96_39975 [Polyangiaceae bacterium]|nr:hypothetical protein [Polyangiaceae bacterium]